MERWNGIMELWNGGIVERAKHYLIAIITRYVARAGDRVCA